MRFRFFACIICMIMVLSVFFGCSGKETKEEILTTTAEQTNSDVLVIPSDKDEGNVATPDETGARLGKIPGFTQKNSLSAHALPQTAGDGSVTVVSVGEYTGAYVEDGTDLQVSKVAAVIVQNTGSKPIQHATVNLGAGEEKFYTFSLSTLPVGCSALVLDTEKRVLEEDKEISAFSADVTKCEEFATNSDKVEVTAKDGVIKLRNLTDTDFRGVYVRYKNFTSGNIYFGGITYSASFDNVGAKGSYEYKAAHFYKDYSHILMVQIIE